MRSPYLKPSTPHPRRIVATYRAIEVLYHRYHGSWVFSFLSPFGVSESQSSLELAKARIDLLLAQEEELISCEEHF